MNITTVARGTHVTHEIEMKRSRFIADVVRTDSAEDAREAISHIKVTHPQARHHCSAYAIWQPDSSPLGHSSDDGEPSGTAGKPMFEALTASGLWNVTVVVTRYFGGILLGAGGLVRAYSTATSEGLALARRSLITRQALLTAELPVAEAGRIEAALRVTGAHILDMTWGATASITVACDPAEADTFHRYLAELTAGTATFTDGGTTTIEIDAES